MAAYTWTNLLQVLCVIVWYLALTMHSVAVPAIDYPAYNAKTDFIVNNPGDVAACEADTLLGQTSCVSDLYTSRAWRTFEWYVIYGIMPLAQLVTLITVIYLMFQRYGLLWFVAAAAWVVMAVALVGDIIVTSIYWANCKDHTACANARFVYADMLGFGSNVHQSTASFWIVLMVSTYTMLLCVIALFLSSILTQCCLSFAVDGRELGLDPLLTREDKRRLHEANNIASTIDGSETLLNLSARHDKGL